jgi:hypothetical protein
MYHIFACSSKVEALDCAAKGQFVIKLYILVVSAMGFRRETRFLSEERLSSRFR